MRREMDTVPIDGVVPRAWRDARLLKIGGGTKVWQSSLAGKRLGRAYALTSDVTGDAAIAARKASAVAFGSPVASLVAKT